MYLYRFMLKTVRDPDLAEDLVQETFLRAWRRWTQFEERGKILGWLSTIALNCARNYFRDMKNPKHSPPGGMLHLDDDRARIDVGRESHVEVTIALGRAMRSLSRGERRIFAIHHIEGLSHDEMKQMGISESTSKTAAYRARNKLQKKLWPQRAKTIVARRTT